MSVQPASHVLAQLFVHSPPHVLAAVCAPVDRIVGLDGVRSEIAMMRTPDGNGRIELDKFYAPPTVRPEPQEVPVNTLGIRRIMFAVDDIEDVVARLKAKGAELMGEVTEIEEPS